MLVQLHFMRGTPLMKLFDYYNNNASEGSFHLKNLKWWKVDLQENENWKSVNLSLSTDSLKLYRLIRVSCALRVKVILSWHQESDWFKIFEKSKKNFVSISKKFGSKKKFRKIFCGRFSLFKKMKKKFSKFFFSKNFSKFFFRNF